MSLGGRQRTNIGTVSEDGGEGVPALPSRVAGARILPALRLLASLAIAASLGCGLDDLPENPTSVVALPVARSVLLPSGETQQRRNLVDGVATDPEWAEVPYQYVAMGPEHGNGGGSFIAALKVVHDSARVYVLVQWPDATPDNLGPRLVFSPSRALTPNGCDSLLITCSWRLTDADEDRLAIMWDLGNAGDGGGTFKDRGCQVACHGNMHPATGTVDIWQWRAARTNPIQFPIENTGARVGFAEDGYADAEWRILDPGAGFYRENYREVRCPDGSRSPVPLETAVALDLGGQPTTRVNDNMRPCEFVYDVTGNAFDECFRTNPCRQFNQEDVETWVAGDEVSGMLLSRPQDEGQRRSLHDVEARGQWVQEGPQAGTWTLEMSRLLGGSGAEDLSFELNRPEPYHMAFAIMDNDGETHSGSPVIEIRFQR